MPIRLSIEAESVEELDVFLARFARTGDTAMPAARPTPAAEPEKPAPAKGGRGKKAETAAAPTQQPDGTPIPPEHAPTPQPTPGGTDAPPAESIPPNQGAAVDPFASPSAVASSTGAASPQPAASGEAVAATPSATSPAAQAAEAAGEPTIQQLKDAMADLLKAKSASFAMKTLEEATGCKSLTSGSPSVAEKAKDDPTILRRTLDALVAAKTA